MSETSKKPSLDALLRAWPDAEKSPAEWEENADRIVTRARASDRARGAAYVSDEDLLSAPLGQSEEDGHNSAARLANEGSKMTMQDRERDRRSLQDLAKLAQTQGMGLTPPPPSARVPAPSSSRAGEAKGDDSGLIDLRAVASEPAPSVRPAAPPAPSTSTPLASQGLFDDEPASMRAPVSVQQPAPSIPPMPASIPPASAPHAMTPPPSSVAPLTPVGASLAPLTPVNAEKTEKKRGGAVIALFVGGLIAVSGAAAGTFFYLKTHRAASATAVAQAPAPEVKAPTAAPPPANADPAQAHADSPATEPSLDPNSLPTATPDSNAKVALAAKGARGRSGAARAAAAQPEAPKPEAKLTQKDLPAAPTGPAGDLNKAMASAVGPQDKPKDAIPAAGSNLPTGSVPQKPSQGAVTGAIGAVLPEARSCLGPDDPVSHASIVFGSAGSVQSVSVTGAAAGKPAEACIKAALSKAKVGPFAEPTYSTRITVRHN